MKIHIVHSEKKTLGLFPLSSLWFSLALLYSNLSQFGMLTAYKYAFPMRCQERVFLLWLLLLF